jgi:hypothetical protein
MNTTTFFTAVEAEAACARYQYLVGKTLICEYTDFCLIDAIVVAPFPDVDKFRFAIDYINTHDAPKALATYSGSQYDVLVFGSSIANPEAVLYESLSDYLKHELIDLTIEQIPSYHAE